MKTVLMLALVALLGRTAARGLGGRDYYQNPGGGAHSGGVSDEDRKPIPGAKKKHKGGGGDTRTPEDEIPAWEKPDPR